MLLLPALLVAASRLGSARAVSFDVKPGETMCVSEEVMKDELAVGEYSVPTDAATGLSQVSVHVTGPTPLKTGGASKVSMEVMRSVLVTMQSEGKLGGTTGGGKGHGSQSTPNLTGGDRPKSSPNL